MNQTPDKTPADAAPTEPWYMHVPVVGMLVENWHKHPVAGVCAVLILILMAWSLWANWNDTFGNVIADQEQAKRDAEVDQSFAHVEDKVAQVTETLDALKAEGKLLVALTPEQVVKLRELGQPKLDLFYYDQNNSRLGFDAAAPEMKPGQSLHMEFADGDPASPAAHKYLLAIKSSGDVQLYTAGDVLDAGGDWEISDPVDNETLLVLAADHELTEDERAQIVADLAAIPPDQIAIKRNKMYVWNNGEIVQQARPNETRDLKRNPNAPADWVNTVSRKLAERNLAFNGYTYPVADDE